MSTGTKTYLIAHVTETPSKHKYIHHSLENALGRKKWENISAVPFIAYPKTPCDTITD